MKAWGVWFVFRDFDKVDSESQKFRQLCIFRQHIV